jgi:hypothetical protein
MEVEKMRPQERHVLKPQLREEPRVGKMSVEEAQ